MYKILCDCGYTVQIAPASAGGEVSCPKCRSIINVPRLTQLKRDAGETISMLSVADELAIALSERKPPFDGTCQICRKQKATDLLPTFMRYLERRVMTGDAVNVTPLGVSVGYAPANEYWRHVDIPCLFCKVCGEEFRQDWRRAKRAAIASKLLNAAFLFPLALVAIVLIAILPFVALSLAIFIVYAIYRQATRKRADRFIAAHLRKLPSVEKLFEEDEYSIGYEGFQEIETPTSV